MSENSQNNEINDKNINTTCTYSIRVFFILYAIFVLYASSLMTHVLYIVATERDKDKILCVLFKDKSCNSVTFWSILSFLTLGPMIGLFQLIIISSMLLTIISVIIILSIVGISITRRLLCCNK